MNTKKQDFREAEECFKFVQNAITKPSFIRKTEVKPYMQTRDNWVIIQVQFKRKICWEFPLSLTAYTYYKRMSLGHLRGGV